MQSIPRNTRNYNNNNNNNSCLPVVCLCKCYSIQVVWYSGFLLHRRFATYELLWICAEKNEKQLHFMHRYIHIFLLFFFRVPTHNNIRMEWQSAFFCFFISRAKLQRQISLSLSLHCAKELQKQRTFVLRCQSDSTQRYAQIYFRVIWNDAVDFSLLFVLCHSIVSI